MVPVLLLALQVAAPAPAPDTVAAVERAVEGAVERGRIDSAWAALAPRARQPSAGRLLLLEAGVVAYRARHPDDAVTLLRRALDAGIADAISIEAHTWPPTGVHPRRGHRSIKLSQAWSK